MRSRAELFDEASRKRALAEQQSAAYGDAKRQRLGVDAGAAQLEIAPLAPGQNSLADIFTLTANPHLRAFNASQVPVDLAAKISVSTLMRVDSQLLDRAINVRKILPSYLRCPPGLWWLTPIRAYVTG